MIFVTLSINVSLSLSSDMTKGTWEGGNGRPPQNFVYVLPVVNRSKTDQRQVKESTQQLNTRMTGISTNVRFGFLQFLQKFLVKICILTEPWTVSEYSYYVFSSLNHMPTMYSGNT